MNDDCSDEIWLFWLFFDFNVFGLIIFIAAYQI